MAPLPDTALVLTAGLGTRLRPLTEVRAKPALPVAGEPLIRRIVRGLVEQGVTRLVLNLHHLPESLASVVGDGTDLGASVRYSWEQPSVLGSAGGPRQAIEIIGTSPFWLVNGDTLTDVDLAAMARTHQSSDAPVTLALVPNREPHKYGGVRLDGHSQVTGFVRRGSGAQGSFHFIGVQMVDAEVFRPLPAGRPTDSIGGLYDRLIREKPGSIVGFVSGASFLDVGTVRDYMAASAALSRAAASTGHRVRIDPTADVSNSIFWDDITVAAGCRLRDCIVTDGVRVPAGASYDSAILMRGSDGALDVRAIPQPS